MRRLIEKSRFDIGDEVIIHKVILPEDSHFEGVIGKIVSKNDSGFYCIDTAGINHWMAKELRAVESIDLSDISLLKI